MAKFSTFSINFCLLSFTLSILILPVYSANILFYFGVASYSHRIAVWPLVEKLADRGHAVTFLSPYPPKKPHPKVTEVTLNAVRELLEGDQDTILEHREQGKLQEDWENFSEFGKMACQLTLESPQIKEWVKKAKFDLVVIDVLYNECALGLAHVFKSKVILYSTTSVPFWLGEWAGSVPETSWIPELLYFYKEPMSFLQRIHNTFTPLHWRYWVRGHKYYPELEDIMKKGLGIQDLPRISELESNASLLFFNSHYSIEYARSLPPAFVSVGGLHLESKDKPTPIPKDMLKFIEESGPDGVIFVSFGTYAKISKLQPEIKSVFYEVFGSFKSLRFIWKVDKEGISDLPKNVYPVTWVPQQELFAHKKIKAFISHGGLLGIQEATAFGIPIIVFPLFAEQDYNGNIIEKSGCGIKLEIIGITKAELTDAIHKITTDNSYKSRMVEISKLFKDRPVNPLDTAVWWTEYILRHDDAKFLKPLGLHQTWYERRLLDVWLFLLSLLLFSVFSVVFIFAKIFSRRKSVSKLDSKKMKKS